MVFKLTNEDLDAITRTLIPRPYDKVLAICGSGDQPLALLEDAGEVYAIDKNEDQIEYAREKIKQLRDNRIDDFFHINNSADHIAVEKRKIYFSKSKRLEKIISKLNNLVVCKRNLSDFNYYGRFNKIYLSNVLTYDVRIDYCQLLEQMAFELSVGSIVYTARDVEFRLIERKYKGIKHRLTEDTDLTKMARMYSIETQWKPIVYRKVLQ